MNSENLSMPPLMAIYLYIQVMMYGCILFDTLKYEYDKCLPWFYIRWGYYELSYEERKSRRGEGFSLDGWMEHFMKQLALIFTVLLVLPAMIERYHFEYLDIFFQWVGVYDTNDYIISRITQFVNWTESIRNNTEEINMQELVLKIISVLCLIIILFWLFVLFLIHWADGLFVFFTLIAGFLPYILLIIEVLGAPVVEIIIIVIGGYFAVKLIRKKTKKKNKWDIR